MIQIIITLSGKHKIFTGGKNMSEMQSYIGVNEGSGGIIGKLLYYSTSNILIPKNTFAELGKAFNLPKIKPSRESPASAYRYATTALKERIVNKDASGTYIYRIYCRLPVCRSRQTGLMFRRYCTTSGTTFRM